jgi:hypothetical protein
MKYTLSRQLHLKKLANEVIAPIDSPDTRVAFKKFLDIREIDVEYIIESGAWSVDETGIPSKLDSIIISEHDLTLTIEVTFNIRWEHRIIDIIDHESEEILLNKRLLIAACFNELETFIFISGMEQPDSKKAVIEFLEAKGIETTQMDIIVNEGALTTDDDGIPLRVDLLVFRKIKYKIEVEVAHNNGWDFYFIKEI